MAYLMDLGRMCQRCHSRRASKALYNRFNGHVGDYCGKCANSMLKREQEVEREKDKEGRRAGG